MDRINYRLVGWKGRLPSRAARVTLGKRGATNNDFFKTWIENPQLKSFRLGDALLDQLCHVFYSHLHHFLTKFSVFKTVYIFWSKKERLKRTFYPLTLQKLQFWPPIKKNGKNDPHV